MNRSNSLNNTDEGNVPFLLNKLCNYYAGNNYGIVSAYFVYYNLSMCCVTELSTRLYKIASNYLTISSSNKQVIQDEQAVVHQIRKLLACRQSPESVQHFDLLYANLQKAVSIRVTNVY